MSPELQNSELPCGVNAHKLTLKFGEGRDNVILKKKDSLSARRLELNLLLEKFDLPESKLWRVERELKNLEKGERGEKDAAYNIDFYFGQSKNFALVHDLRLEHESFSAQIDHLIINRFMEFHVLETKSYGETLEITSNGEFIAHYGEKSISIPSPIEQNDRHIHLLKKIIQGKGIAPKRLGMAIPCKYENFVLVDPSTKIKRPSKSKFDTSNVLHADRWVNEYRSRIERESTASAALSSMKIIGCGTLNGVGQKIVAMHKPGSFNYKEQLGITEEDLLPKGSRPKVAEPEKQYRVQKGGRNSFFCASCKTDIPKVVFDFCMKQKMRYGGRAYCRECQKNF